VTSRLSPEAWEAFLARHPDAHLLQSSAWGDLKAHFGWEPVRLARSDSGAQILVRRFPFGLRLAYVPRGPVGAWLPDLLPDLIAACREQKVFAIKLEPDAPEATELEADLRRHGFHPSPHTVQPRRTLAVDLLADEAVLLGRMHSKTRYNIRLAERKGVSVRASSDLPAFQRLLGATAQRDQFSVHSPGYYAKAFELFQPRGECELFLADNNGRTLAGLMAFARGSKAWYLYGASSNEGRNLMSTYLLQWEAMRWAKARGCRVYDLWGIPDESESVLEAGFPTRNDGLWGVYRFKRGFGGVNVRTVGAWDLPLQPFVYRFYANFAGRLRGQA
jgi:lipid II:glycine glycyltransferase (peptidoglycan interpeptide bridge formation enzyme)